MNPGDREADRRIRRQEHVHDLRECHRASHAREHLDPDDPSRLRHDSAGAFIQAFTITTKTADAAPESATTRPAAMCAIREIRSHA